MLCTIAFSCFLAFSLDLLSFLKCGGCAKKEEKKNCLLWVIRLRSYFIGASHGGFKRGLLFSLSLSNPNADLPYTHQFQLCGIKSVLTLALALSLYLHMFTSSAAARKPALLLNVTLFARLPTYCCTYTTHRIVCAHHKTHYNFHQRYNIEIGVRHDTTTTFL